MASILASRGQTVRDREMSYKSKVVELIKIYNFAFDAIFLSHQTKKIKWGGVTRPPPCKIGVQRYPRKIGLKKREKKGIKVTNFFTLREGIIY